MNGAEKSVLGPWVVTFSLKRRIDKIVAEREIGL